MPLDIELPRSGASSVIFRGRSLGTATTTDPGAPDVDRVYELTLYARDGDGPPAFVVAIAFRTRRPRELAQDYVVTGDHARHLAQRLQQWCALHDPADLLTGFPPGAQFDAKRDHLAQRLRALLNRAISQLLAQLPGSQERL